VRGRKPGRPILTELPPLDMVRAWREQGLSPQEVFQKCVDFDAKRRQALCSAEQAESNGHRRKHGHDAGEFWRLYQEHTLKEVGVMVKLSDERVRQILHEAGYSTRLHVRGRN
jgi:hypothetical protein